MTLKQQVAIIAALPADEREGLGWVCINQDDKVSRCVLDKLLKKGLIFKSAAGIHDVASYWIHMAWCEYCSTLPEETDD